MDLPLASQTSTFFYAHTPPAAAGPCSTGAAERPKRKRGKRGGLHARLKARATRPPLPSLLLANVRSLENKLDKLRTRITTQCETSALILTEIWLSDTTPDSAIQLETHSVHCGDHTAALGKNKGGAVWIYHTDNSSSKHFQ
ncbi:hypothetical protein AOLI_G00101250 [Acnodon oligacanthus]